MNRVWFGKVALLAGTAMLLTACSGGPEKEWRTVTVSGDVSMAAGPMPAGTLNFRLYNLWYLDGDLRHSLEEIEDFQSGSGSFSHTFEYPVHKGSGLALHAWLDTDGDGFFCTPSERVDPAGFVWQEDVEGVDTVTFNIKLTDNCRAANYFFPPEGYVDPALRAAE